MPRIKEKKRLVMVSAQVPEDLRDEARALAERDERNLSYAVRVGLRHYVKLSREQEREAA